MIFSVAFLLTHLSGHILEHDGSHLEVHEQLRLQLRLRPVESHWLRYSGGTSLFFFGKVHFFEEYSLPIIRISLPPPHLELLLYGPKSEVPVRLRKLVYHRINLIIKSILNYLSSSSLAAPSVSRSSRSSTTCSAYPIWTSFIKVTTRLLASAIDYLEPSTNMAT